MSSPPGEGERSASGLGPFASTTLLSRTVTRSAPTFRMPVPADQPAHTLARQDGIRPVVAHNDVALNENVFGHRNREPGQHEAHDAGGVSDRGVTADDDAG